KDKWLYQTRMDATHETLALVELLRKAWTSNKIQDPTQVGLTLADLMPIGRMTLSIFEPDNCRHRLATAVDTLNEKFGKNTILPAGLMSAKESAEERIAFQKVELFDEGRARV